MRGHMKHSGRSARKVISQEAMRVNAAARRIPQLPTAPPPSPRRALEDDGLITITFFDTKHPQGLVMGKVTPEGLAEMQAAWPEQLPADPVELERVRKHINAIFDAHAVFKKVG